MASPDSSMDGSSSGEALPRSFSGNDRNRENSSRDYDSFKQPGDKAMHELQVLRRQHSEAVRRCEHTMKELDYYRNQHHAAMSQLEAAAKESSSLRTMYSELIRDKQRLDREVTELQTSICNQQDVIVAENGNSDSINQHFISTLSKYEVVKDEYESLRKRYDDLISSHSSAVDKLELAQEEVGRLKNQCEEMVKERNSVLRERNGLKQQCTAVIRQWDMALHERNEVQAALKALQEKHDKAVKEFNAAMAVRMKASEDLKWLTEERNAAMAEYNLVMSERDSVHKEIEKLSEDLSVAFNKNQALEAEMKESIEEKKALTYHIETLKREIASALHDRDKALKECNDLREKFGEFTAKEESQREAMKSRFEYAYSRERDTTRNDAREVEAASIDMFVKSQKERMDNLDQANQEIDRLTKQNEKLQAELQEALQEAQVSKRRRDWAFSERDKIMWERESIRTLCDQLRKERDRAVSDLAEALRDSDDIKKQKNETTKELKVLKEKMEAQLEKESRILQFHSTEHSHSHDSAIDTDLAEWDTETVNINLSGLGSEEDLGFELIGGRDDPYFANDSAIYVANVVKGSITDGKLRANDCIMRVNNFDCSNVSKRMVVETIKSSTSNSVVLVVKRRRIGARSLFTTHLQLNNYEHGLTLENGYYISRISPGSLAAKEGNLAIGDRVLSINNRPLDGVGSLREAMALLNEPGNLLTLTTLKTTHCSSNCRAEMSNRDVYKKYTNSSSQTENKPTYMWYSEKPIYEVPEKPALEKPSTSNKWDLICDKMDVVHGRCGRSLKEEKKHIHDRDASPVPFDQERDDAIAELDSVIDSYHCKHSHHHKSKEMDKNGGTWPKVRGGPLIEHKTGTIMHPRKNKERLPLSVLLNNPPNYNFPPCCQRPEEQRSSIAQKDGGIDFSVKSGNIGKEVLEYYVKKKTPKQYQSSDTESNADSQSHSRIHSQLYGTPHYPFTPFLHPVSHSHAHNRYSSLTHQSNEPVSLSDPRSYCFEPSVPSYSPLSSFHHTHSPSVDSAYHKSKSIVPAHSHPGGCRAHDDLPVPESYQPYHGGTFPRKKENQRFRIPSNPSVASKSSGGKVSTGSIEKSSERGSPMPTFHVEVLSSGSRQNKRNSLPDYCWSQKPLPGELRRVHIDKSVEPLGIQISCLKSGGVFVSTVSEHSLASQVGLQVGDQLLEVCGINMRSATYQLAANVLRQCGNSITMLVQYSPDKYHELEGGSSSSGESRSDTPTPCNSPESRRKSNPAVGHTISTLTRQKNQDSDGPRYLTMETGKCSNLGISLVGGNAVGIYVHSVQISSLAYNAGLRTGDRILEYNSTNLRQATAEEAAYELAKPADKVTVLAQYNIDRYNEIKDKPGDSFYIRAMFDRTGELGDDLQLRFHKDDVLYVDNTMFNGIPGNWRAWLVDQDGYQHQCGIIPSKYKVEEELLLRRSLGDLEGRTTRRSFFRRKKHQRSDSKELASFSSINLGWYSDSGSLNEETALASYQKVVRLDSEPVFRPVIIVGPLSDCVIEKLIQDFPDKFLRCVPEIMHCSQSTIEKGLNDNLFIDYRKKGSYFECVTAAAVKDSCDKNCHCVLDVGLTSVERLHRHQVYPIVLLIKFKSPKQIREVKDSRFPLDKVGAKAAKEMYEHALKIEVEYKHFISAVIPAGVNVAYMCTQIKSAVDSEQAKTLWVPCANNM